MNNTEIVTFEKGEARTTSLIIAEGAEVEHRSVMQLVKKYQSDLEEFGHLTFQMRVVERNQGGGTPGEVAMLNEQQSTLIMMYLKNTPIVREFKKALVRAFFELRDMARDTADKRVDVNMSHTRGVTNLHGLDIKYNLDLTKILQHPTRVGLALLERLTGVCLDEIIDNLPAGGLGTASSVTLAAFAKAHLQEVSGGRVSKPQVYAAYLAYCAEQKTKPLSVIGFGRELMQLCPSITDGKTLGSDKQRVGCYCNIELVTPGTAL